MRSLISALAAAGLLMFTLSCYSADEPYTGQSKAEKPGRAGEEKQAVKSKPGPVADFESIGAFFPGSAQVADEAKNTIR